MKIGDRVLIVATIPELDYIPAYNRDIILMNPVGHIHKIHSAYLEIRTCLGIWEFKKNNVKLYEEKE